MYAIFHNRKSRKSSVPHHNTVLLHHQPTSNHPISVNTTTPVLDPSLSENESMEDEIYGFEKKIIKMEKELEDMKGGLKEIKENLSASKRTENIILDTDASSVDGDDATNAHASTSLKPMDGSNLDDSLNDSMHDHNQKDLDVVIVFNDSCSRSYKSHNDDAYNTHALEADVDNTMNASMTSHNQTNSEGHQVTSNNMNSNNEDRQKKSKLYNTEGIYIHTILSIGYMEAGPIKCWMYAIGTLLLVCLQITLLDFVVQDRFHFNENREADFCAHMGPGLTTTLIAMAIIFTSAVFEDIKESMVEEAILVHAVIHQKDKISSPPALGLIRICLHVRRFLLPWLLIRSAIFATFSGTNLDQSDIILDFLSISVIVEADNIMGRFFFSETRNQLADILVREINTEYDDEDKNNVYFRTSSQVWPRILAIIPTMSITIGSIILKSANDCGDRMFRFMTFFVDFVLPLALALPYWFGCCIQDKSNDSLLEKYIRFLGEGNLNGVAFFVVYTVAGAVARRLYSGIEYNTVLDITWIFLLFFLLSRIFYVKYIHNQEITWKHMVYILLLSSVFFIGIIDLFVDACFGIDLIWFFW